MINIDNLDFLFLKKGGVVCPALMILVVNICNILIIAINVLDILYANRYIYIYIN